MGSAHDSVKLCLFENGYIQPWYWLLNNYQHTVPAAYLAEYQQPNLESYSFITREVRKDLPEDYEAPKHYFDPWHWIKVNSFLVGIEVQYILVHVPQCR